MESQRTNWLVANKELEISQIVRISEILDQKGNRVL